MWYSKTCHCRKVFVPTSTPIIPTQHLPFWSWLPESVSTTLFVFIPYSRDVEHDSWCCPPLCAVTWGPYEMTPAPSLVTWLCNTLMGRVPPTYGCRGTPIEPVSSGHWQDINVPSGLRYFFLLSIIFTGLQYQGSYPLLYTSASASYNISSLHTPSSVFIH